MKNYKSTGTCLSAVPVNSSARNGIRVQRNHDDDVASVMSSSVGVVTSNDEHTPFITQNLNKVRQTKSGKLSLDFCVGNRLAAIQRYESKLSSVSGCGLYFNANPDPTKNNVTIIANDIEHMVDGINTIANINNRLKTHGIAMETVEIPLPKIKNILPVIELMQSVTTFETPLVSCNIGRNLIVIIGPSTQIADVVTSLTASIEKLCPKSKVVQKAGATSANSANSANSTKTHNVVNLTKDSKFDVTPRSYSLPIVDADANTDTDVIDDAAAAAAAAADDIDDADSEDDVFTEYDGYGAGSNTEVITDSELPIRLSNHLVKPPSKADTARVKASGGRSGGSSAKRSKMSEYEADVNQIYCVIQTVDGGNKVIVKVISKDDELFNTKSNARISGSMSRRGNKAGKGKNLKANNRIAPGQVVLASKRDFETKWLDIIKKVPDDIVQSLIHNNLIPKSYYENPFGAGNGTISGYGDDDNNDYGFEFSNSTNDSGGLSGNVSTNKSVDFDIDFDTI
jgi:hypothetical protein